MCGRVYKGMIFVDKGGFWCIRGVEWMCASGADVERMGYGGVEK